MAYLARIEPQEPVLDVQELLLERSAEAHFSELEWSIIRLARLDRLSTLRKAGPARRLINRLLGKSTNPRLASDRLEAIRRISVLSWHFGFAVPGEDVAEFLSAGFSPEQYELLVNSIRQQTSSVIPFQSGASA